MDCLFLHKMAASAILDLQHSEILWMAIMICTQDHDLISWIILEIRLFYKKIAAATILNITGSSNVPQLWRMMSYIYIPNLVEISLNIANIPSCTRHLQYQLIRNAYRPTLDHSQRQFADPYLVAKFVEINCADLNHSNFNFLPVWLQMPIHTPSFGGFWD